MKRPRRWADLPRLGRGNPQLLRGLRARLVVGFLVVAAVSALTTALLTYQEARNAILQSSQDTAVNDLRAQVNSLAPEMPVPPSQADLDSLRVQLERSDKRGTGAFRCITAACGTVAQGACGATS